VLRERATRREFVVWNTHWDHRGERARLESARLIADWVRACGAPSIVLGDFNAEESSAPLELLRAASLRDSFRDLHPDAREVGTYHAFRGGKSGPKIDYCLVTRQWRSLGAGLLDQRGAHGRWPSDHHGVWAVLERVD
jgi:endonuclease/exonuclease/phosphatase family metal-dependent hydrolase